MIGKSRGSGAKDSRAPVSLSESARKKILRHCKTGNSRFDSRFYNAARSDLTEIPKQSVKAAIPSVDQLWKGIGFSTQVLLRPELP